MRKMALFGLVGLILLGGCAYYPVKSDVKLLDNIIVKENLVFDVVVDKAKEVKISEETLSVIRSLISKELKNKNVKTQKNAPLLAKVHITTYKEGNIALRLLGGTLHGAGRASIEATILITQNGIVVLEGIIESKMSKNPFNIGGIYGTERGVQETFAEEVVKALEKLKVNR